VAVDAAGIWVLVFVTRPRVLENGGILLRANTWLISDN
jgi:hypothetical protein